jgi:tagatose-1,6-bisphosphate aldolase
VSSSTSPPASLAPIAASDGTFAIVAMDQRNSLRRMLAAAGRSQEPEDLRRLKADVAGALMPSATGILLDPDYGVPALRDSEGADGCGLLVAAEPAERGDHRGEPRSSRLPAQDARWVRDMGGDSLKFLVQMRPDRPSGAGEPDLVTEVLDVVREVVEDCRAAGVPSVIENLVYQLPGEDSLAAEHRSDLVVASARLLDDLQPDLLKLEYPGSPQACRRLADVISGPWAVLSAGVGFEEFRDVLRISCDEGGASGFIAGRAIWKEAVGMEGDERTAFLRDVARPRLEACIDVIDGRARPWQDARRGASVD